VSVSAPSYTPSDRDQHATYSSRQLREPPSKRSAVGKQFKVVSANETKNMIHAINLLFCLLLCTLVDLATSANLTDCACGLGGESCLELLPGFTSSFNMSCNTVESNARCFASGDGTPKCDCPCTITGDQCTEPVAETLAYNYAVGICVPVFVFVVAHWVIHRYHRLDEGAEFAISRYGCH
jgi:hypothetical protein